MLGDYYLYVSFVTCFSGIRPCRTALSVAPTWVISPLVQYNLIATKTGNNTTPSATMTFFISFHCATASGLWYQPNIFFTIIIILSEIRSKLDISWMHRFISELVNETDDYFTGLFGWKLSIFINNCQWPKNERP